MTKVILPITFVTGNKKKLAEVQTILPHVSGVDYDLTEIQSLDMETIVRVKTMEARKIIDGPIIVDDTAFYLDALNSVDGSPGMPGPFIKWFLETMGNRKLAQLAISLGNTRAWAKTIIGYSDTKNDCVLFEGTMNGMVTVPNGEIGFGWDMICIPDGGRQTLGSMTTEEKNSYSMRAQAVKKLKDYLALD